MLRQSLEIKKGGRRRPLCCEATCTDKWPFASAAAATAAAADSNLYLSAAATQTDGAGASTIIIADEGNMWP